jgi:hypothetical protein
VGFIVVVAVVADGVWVAPGVEVVVPQANDTSRSSAPVPPPRPPPSTISLLPLPRSKENPFIKKGPEMLADFAWWGAWCDFLDVVVTEAVVGDVILRIILAKEEEIGLVDGDNGYVGVDAFCVFGGSGGCGGIADEL